MNLKINLFAAIGRVHAVPTHQWDRVFVLIGVIRMVDSTNPIGLPWHRLVVCKTMDTRRSQWNNSRVWALPSSRHNLHSARKRKQVATG